MTMPLPAAKLGDGVTAVDTHIVLVPTPSGPVPVPAQLPFSGTITNQCSPTVSIMGRPAAVVGSQAVNQPPHVPPDGTFANPPTNLGVIVTGSPTVWIDGVPAARSGDQVATCNDPAPLPVGMITALGTVFFG
ncbi:PAAR domain-containing protein [Amycolatopsis sp. cg5]|uniref:PAAR domain-containing protein n=1 Tax=Amycolatopsis sp. cg5 TaxID=3238802 RepID=UPI0035242D9E